MEYTLDGVRSGGRYYTERITKNSSFVGENCGRFAVSILRFGAGWICLIVFLITLPITLLTTGVAVLGLELAYPDKYAEVQKCFKQIDDDEL